MCSGQPRLKTDLLVMVLVLSPSADIRASTVVLLVPDSVEGIPLLNGRFHSAPPHRNRSEQDLVGRLLIGRLLAGGLLGRSAADVGCW
jgi:hypothetical protein